MTKFTGKMLATVAVALFVAGVIYAFVEDGSVKSIEPVRIVVSD